MEFVQFVMVEISRGTPVIGEAVGIIAAQLLVN